MNNNVEKDKRKYYECNKTRMLCLVNRHSTLHPSKILHFKINVENMIIQTHVDKGKHTERDRHYVFRDNEQE